MFLDLTSEQRTLQTEIRAYFADLMAGDLAGRVASADFSESPEYKALIRRVGEDGWLGVGWPVEYGGKGFTPIEQHIFFDESQAAGCPIPFLTTNTVGPTIRRYGTDEQRAFFLPRILAGDLHFSIGYTEPDAGTDLASLRTKAVRDGDEWVIDGQKAFTSLAYNADYIWLAARTDPDTPGREGITIFAVDTRDPGFSIQPFETFGTTHTTTTFYDGVRVPDTMRIGEVNGGWGLITSQLNRERVSLFPAGRMARLVDDAVSWAGETRLADGRRAIDQERVKVILAECLALVRHLDLLNWWVAHENTNGRMNPADASSVKVHGSESMHRIYTRLTEAVGTPGHPDVGSPGADLAARIEVAYRSVWVLTFGGGTNEIQRDIIGAAGLGLPREQRRK